MLRRLNDERVFAGSQDVVYSAASASIAQRNARRRGPAPLVGDGARNRMLPHENGGAQCGDEDIEGGSADDDDDDDDDEEEMFRDSRHPPSERYHPQHPYNTQLNALAKTTAKSPRERGVKIVRNHRGANHHAAAAGVYDTATQPMEFVFLPNGEIRPRDECPPGLAPPPPAAASIASETPHHLLAGHAAEQEHRQRAYLQEQKQQPADLTLRHGDTAHRQHRKAAEDAKAATRHSQRSRPVQPTRVRTPSESSDAALSSSSSSPSDSSASSRTPTSAAQATQRRRVENASNAAHMDERGARDSPESLASSGYEEDEEKENIRRQGHHAPPAAVAPKGKKKEVAVAGTGRLSSRQESEPMSTRPQDQAHHRPYRQSQRKFNEEQHSREKKGKAKSSRQPQDMTLQRRQDKEKSRRSPSSSASEDESQASWSYRPKAGKYDSVHVHHSRSAAKMDVRDLLNDNAKAPKLASRSKKAPGNDDQREKIAYLEQELQREKKRVLEKMTQLLEEQGKNQQLQHQLDVAQSQLATRERETGLKVKEAVREKDESFSKAEAQWKASVQSLEDQVHVKDAAVLRLETEKEQLKQALTKLKDKQQQESSSAQATTDRESVSTKRQIEKIVSKLKKFHAQVEAWKASSKEAMASCESRKSEMRSLVESLWLDFPAFPFLDNADNAAKAGDSEVSEPANMILFLKKRLRLREDELRETHVKYVELKELCARQCVREADLQNFINEHRLRGNLVIRKDDAATSREHAAVEDNAAKRNVHFHAAPQQQQRSDVKTKMIVNRTTNTSPTYHENGNNSEYDGDNDGDESGDADADAAEEDEYEDDNQHEHYLQEPKVFVQVSRDGVYEHTPRRLASSSSAALKKLEEEQRGHKMREFRDVERIRLVPSPTLARRYERVPEEPPLRSAAASRRKAPASNNNHAVTSSRAVSKARRPTAATALALNGAGRSNSGSVRRKPSVQPPPAIVRTTRSRSAVRAAGAHAAPWM